VAFVQKGAAGDALPGGIILLNCTSCDDILRLDEDHVRPCFCGKATARFVQGKWLTSGPSRLLHIAYEDYDGAVPGLPRTWRVV
jgi:hypothetical protein